VASPAKTVGGKKGSLKIEGAHAASGNDPSGWWNRMDRIASRNRAPGKKGLSKVPKPPNFRIGFPPRGRLRSFQKGGNSLTGDWQGEMANEGPGYPLLVGGPGVGHVESVGGLFVTE